MGNLALHDYHITGYNVDFTNRRVHLYAQMADRRVTVTFHGVFAHQFTDELYGYGNIILEISEEPFTGFDGEQATHMQMQNRPGWPVTCDTLPELACELIGIGMRDFIISSSYGLNGWVLAQSVSVTDNE